MGPGVEESREHRYRQHQEVQRHPGSLAIVHVVVVETCL